MELETRQILVALARRYAFREVAYLIGAGATGLSLDQRELARVQQLCAYGQRLSDVDAQDLADPDAAVGANTDTTFAILAGGELVPQALVSRGARCHVRTAPDPGVVDALVDLHPVYRLVLEALAIRWSRYETLALLALSYLAAEYSPLLAWQRCLGHAGDPFRFREQPAFTGADSRWGDIDEVRCPRSKQEKAASARALRVADEPAAGWRSYLDRQHSVVSRALLGCATDCATPCTVMTHLAEPVRQHLGDACRAAAAFRRCALVRLRHEALIGHGLGAPSRDEVADAWERSRQAIGKHGPVAAAVLAEDGYPLPGLPSLFTAIAGAPLEPDTLLAQTQQAVVEGLDPDGLVW